MAERRQRTGAQSQNKDAEDYRDAEDDQYDGGKGPSASTVDKCLLVAIVVSFCLIAHLTLKLRGEASLSDQCDHHTQDLVNQVSTIHKRVSELSNERISLERQADKIKGELKEFDDKRNVLQREVQSLVTRYTDMKKQKVSLLAQHESSKKDMALLAKEEEYLEKLLAETRANMNKTTSPQHSVLW